jgi:poly(hydroxyalkanoate) granule-associated protein
MAETSPGGGGTAARSRSAARPKRRRTASATRSTKASPARARTTRARKATTTAQADVRASGDRWLELVLSVVQAPVGIAQSQTEYLVNQLVRTGSLGQRQAERLLTELWTARERAQGRAEQEAGRLDRFVEGKIEDVLNRINIPSRSDIERLNQSVDVLTAKVESLVNRRDRGGSR